MKKLVLICSILMLQSGWVFAQYALKMQWNESSATYDVFLQKTDNEVFSKLKNLQISLQLSSNNLFLYDIQSAKNQDWSSRRFSSPKEAPKSDFFVFQCSQLTAVEAEQKLFSFRLAGINEKGNLTFANLPEVNCNGHKIRLQNFASFQNTTIDLGVSTEPIPVKINALATKNNAQNFVLFTDHLREEVIIKSNWRTKSGDLFFYFYNLDGELVKIYKTEVESGAQQFTFSYTPFSSGVYFVKAKFEDWETVLNDGFIKDFEWSNIN